MADESNQIPTVTDKRTVPPGILSRNAQSLVLGGLSVLMVLVIVFSGRGNPKPKTSAPSGQEPPVQTLNDDKLREYRKRIDDAAQKLAVEQAQLAQSKASAVRADPTTASPVSGGPGTSAYGSPSGEEPQKSWLQEEKEKKDYQS